ncbi:MAG: A/G-specific adenine glycosylase [Treponema sp.]|nr:A/G-specific adenine glycosylase [Candidatus Treponema caballi]
MESDITAFQKAVLSWYKDNRRSFPWRETSEPYRILVSELMLQQTQTERVLPKYEEFLNAFPTAHDLAEAPLADVLEHWSGLGYNRRARFLQQACQKVVRELGGVFPHTPSELEKLPGVGPYTARAVACFAFGAAHPEAVEPFIETNIRSVFIVFFFKDDMYADGAPKSVSDAQILRLVADSIPSEDVCSAREWFYALMDYGAMLKKKTKNPNRRSSSYTKQSRFKGSVREARGVILRQLVKNKENGLSLSQIQKIEYIDIERLTKAADLLCSESLIIRDGDMYRIV